MVPGVVDRIAGRARGNPSPVRVVPYIPLVSPGDAALLAPDQFETVEIHADIKFQHLGSRNIRREEVRIVSEVVYCRQQGMIAVGHSLCGTLSNDRVAEKDV